MHSSSVPITELIIRNAYSDTAAVTSCSRRHAVDGVSTWSCELRQIDSSLRLLSYSYTAPTALGINIEQIRANVLFSKFLNVVYFF